MPRSSSSSSSDTRDSSRSRKTYDTSDTSSSDDESIESHEPRSAYKPGGFHPVTVGDVLDDRYRITDKVGFGHFSVVWGAVDTRDGDTPVVIKVCRSASKYAELAAVEAKVLRRAASASKDVPEAGVVKLLGQFQVKGPNGTHLCLVMERLGHDLLTLIRSTRRQKLSLDLIRHLTRNIVSSVHKLHLAQYMHMDIKPENIILKHSLPWVDIVEEKRGTPLSDNFDDEEDEDDSEDDNDDTSKDTSSTQATVTLEKPERVISLSTDKVDAATVEDGKDVTLEHGVLKAGWYQLSPVLSKSAKKRRRRFKNKPHDGAPAPAFRVHEDNRVTIPREHFSRVLRAIEFTYPNVRFVRLHGVPLLHGLVTLRRCHSLDWRMHLRETRDVDTSKLDCAVRLVDLNNAERMPEEGQLGCGAVQTRQYRSPEVILGVGYDESADVWSLACVVYELITGDYLFDTIDDGTCDENEDHLAQAMELNGLSAVPRVMCAEVARSCGREWVDKRGKLRHAGRLHHVSMEEVLMSRKTALTKDEIREVAGFLAPCLRFDPFERPSAASLLKHPFLKT